jgi:multicomponent Na+:H+ antiporter subunit B
VALTGIALMVGTFDMSPYGDPTAPIHTQVSKQYLEREYQAFKAAQVPHDAQDAKTDGHKAKAEHPKQVGLPNVVTSILASYRGYDTLGETAVVFTAGVGVMLLLLGRRRRESDEADADSAPDDDAAEEAAPSVEDAADPALAVAAEDGESAAVEEADETSAEPDATADDEEVS